MAGSGNDVAVIMVQVHDADSAGINDRPATIKRHSKEPLIPRIHSRCPYQSRIWLNEVKIQEMKDPNVERLHVCAPEIPAECPNSTSTQRVRTKMLEDGEGQMPLTIKKMSIGSSAAESRGSALHTA